MIQPPKGHNDLPHKVGKHYYMMLAEMMGRDFKHDDYSAIASWLLVYITVKNQEFQDQISNRTR